MRIRPLPVLFSLLFSIVPIIFFPRSSELFEFNKIITVYIFTVLIVAVWLAIMITKAKIIFRRTLLDIPLLIFLITQGLATILSIDYRTSLLGYYSRFNGGFLSSVSYCLLYWAYVSTQTKKDTLKLIQTIFFVTGIVSVYGALEHFGRSPSCLIINKEFNVDCWVQDVQNRVFASFGQPNWLAAWLAATMPLVWFYISKTSINLRNKKFYFYHLLNILIFATLLFTKSRSAFIGVSVSYLVFWGLTKKWQSFLITSSYLFLAIIIIGTPLTAFVTKLFTNSTIPNATSQETQTYIEPGGTESGEIRKIVWQGAVDVWRAYPLFGSGVETFAFAYYQYRPMAHNLVSEWNFLYNKAHNEYLNYLATTGTIGFVSYFLLVAFAIKQTLSIISTNRTQENKKSSFQDIRFAFFAGYISILITNFFGFSVVPISLLTFLFPAFALSIKDPIGKISIDTRSIPTYKRMQLSVVVALSVFFLFSIAKYWYADFAYAKALASKDTSLAQSIDYMKSAISQTPQEAIFHNELADMYARLALTNLDQEEATVKYLQLSVQELKLASDLSPRNIKLLKAQANIYGDLGEIEPSFFTYELQTLEKLANYAPTDPAVFYTTALTYAKLGDTQTAAELLTKTISMKPNYRNARLLLSVIYKEEKEYEKAIDELEYVLQYISPGDEKVEEELTNLKKLV